MRGEKTKAPGKEFSAQVSDYIPSPRRKNSAEHVVVEQNKNISGMDSPFAKKPDRPWNILGRSVDSTLEEPTEQTKQTEHKLDTNRAQTGYKPSTEQDTNRAQTGHKIIGSLKQPLETGHKPDTQPDTERNTNRAQTGHKPDTNSTFTQLVGLQRKVLLFIYRSCQMARSRTTDPLALEHIARSITRF